MALSNANRSTRGRTIGLSAFLLLLAVLLYYQLWYSPKRVESKLFELHSMLAGHRADVWSVGFSPDGNLVASGSVDSTVIIRNKSTGQSVLTLQQPSGITRLAISPGGAFIATAGYDSKVRLWLLPEGKLVKELSGHEGTVWALGFSPDGKTLASSGEDAVIRLWDVETGQPISSLSGHTRNVWDVQFSPDGNTLASGGFDKTIRIWDAASGKLLHTMTDHTEAIVSLAFSPNGRMLVSTSDDKTIRIWRTRDWQLMRTLEVPEHVQASAFSPDNKWLLTGGRDKPMLGEFLQNIFGDSHYNKGVSMRLWAVETGTLLQTFSQHANDVNDLCFSPDGQWIASGSSDKTVGLWRLSAR